MMMLLAHFDGDRRGALRLESLALAQHSHSGQTFLFSSVQLVAPMSYLGRDPPETRERRHRV